MPRGADAKLRRRNRKKQDEAVLTEMFPGDENNQTNGGFTEQVPLPPGLDKDKDSDAESEGDDENKDAPAAAAASDVMPKKKKSKMKGAKAPAEVAPKKSGGIKTMPLILLILMLGTTLLPALIYAGDYLSSYLAKNPIMGTVGYRMGIGHVPRKRVLSFYEKHAPEKVGDVPNILAKHYGEYPTLIRKLERKYQDYGYFIGWEQDETPARMVQDYLADVYGIWIKQWNKYAPQVAKTAARNARYNLTTIYNKGAKIWRKQVWPYLEPIFGVPDGADKQKRKDAAEARKKKATGTSSTTRRRNRDYRDDVEQE